MSAHALLSPSGAERWMNCPGSLAMERAVGAGDVSSPYADEGTAAHFLASEALLEGKEASYYVGRAVLVGDEGATFVESDLNAARAKYTVDYGMASNIQIYLDMVKDIFEPPPDESSMHVEQILPLSHITGEKDAYGTADVIGFVGSEIVVVDLKYGMGVKVDAANNKQLLIYALAALDTLGMLASEDIVTARLVICQPRLGHVSEDVVSVEELELFRQKVKERAKHALACLSEKPEALSYHLKPGDKQCRWCKAKADCGALYSFAQEEMGVDFENVSAIASAEKAVSAATPVELSVKQNAVGLVEAWCKAVRGKVRDELLSGTPIAGWKLVAGRKGTRAWSDKGIAEVLLKNMRVPHDRMYDYSVVSPTTAEKLAKENIIGPRQWPKIQELITQSAGEPAVVSETDKRPALAITPAHAGFDDLTK